MVDEISESELLESYEKTLQHAKEKAQELREWANKVPESHELYQRALCDAVAIEYLLIDSIEGAKTIELIKEFLQV